MQCLDGNTVWSCALCSVEAQKARRLTALTWGAVAISLAPVSIVCCAMSQPYASPCATRYSAVDAVLHEAEHMVNRASKECMTGYNCCAERVEAVSRCLAWALKLEACGCSKFSQSRQVAHLEATSSDHTCLKQRVDCRGAGEGRPFSSRDSRNQSCAPPIASCMVIPSSLLVIRAFESRWRWEDRGWYDLATDRWMSARLIATARRTRGAASRRAANAQ